MTTPTPRPDHPARSWPAETLLPAQGVRLALFDVDGVLTDGGLYLDENGEPIKRFHVLDGQGLRLLQEAGLTVAVISGRDSPALRARLHSLGIAPAHIRLGVGDKLPAAQALLAALGLDWAQVAVIGDDWPDLPLLARAAFACAPPQAHPEALARAHYITRAAGGQGAAREFCDLLLTAGGHYRRMLAQALQLP